MPGAHIKNLKLKFGEYITVNKMCAIIKLIHYMGDSKPHFSIMCYQHVLFETQLMCLYGFWYMSLSIQKILSVS